jgi:4,5-dihydroxyphthalate decarboxylase
VLWVRGGIEDPGRPEKITIKLPPGVRMEDAPEGATISGMLERGEIDGFIAPRPPSIAGRNNPNIGWLFPDPIAAGQDYFKRTGIFPIMHTTAIKQEIVDKYPWVPTSLMQAFEKSKMISYKRMENPRIVPLAWFRSFIEEQEEIFAGDPWIYGLGDANRKNIETLMQYSHEQGLIGRKMTMEELFIDATPA